MSMIFIISWWIESLVIIYWLSLSHYSFWLKFTLSVISLPILTFFWFLFAWNIFFSSFHFQSIVSLMMKWFSCRQHIVGSCIFIHSLCKHFTFLMTSFTYFILYIYYQIIIIIIILIILYLKLLLYICFIQHHHHFRIFWI